MPLIWELKLKQNIPGKKKLNVICIQVFLLRMNFTNIV
jgi:hypothetical protein